MMTRGAKNRGYGESRDRRMYESRANALDDDANANANAFEAYIILRR